ncbi:MAG: zinc-binding dehydrogenase [Candidatus Marinimicrobia bacterium]|jgi:2-desacetyl-2-hydroxyethyl bacteriochlorophyllide A dehydrogenase|nr:zinc-binding dehydrogenase [Candidatus Neomarinimicrobiota bacterium]MDD4961327.1 zinc-binding dehydrogenase [Candidatus Neomarinimicrobiota bacterium]MDD5709752.1 zinc-binding dehydrogenase [Candidatus Neomarinimicrobiota bacterium]MDX9777141.1 zinc-binding dehydrogenase [bacterium]
MRAAIFHHSYEPLSIGNVPDPAVGPHDVLIAIRTCSLCHTDMQFIDQGMAPNMKPPIILGHEIAGVIEEVGSEVKKFKPGEPVIVPATITCNQCLACKSWNETYCENIRRIGIDINGGFAEYIAVPDFHPYRLPHEYEFEVGSLISNLLIGAYHLAFDRVNIRAGEKVVIFGSGGFGLSILQMAKLREAQVYMVDIFDWKLSEAKRLGADAVLNSNKVPVCEEAVQDMLGGKADICIETIGAPRTLMQAINSLKKGGRLVLSGYSENPLPFLIGRIIHNEISLIGAEGAPRRKIPEVIHLLEDGKINIANLVTKRFNLDNINQGISTQRMGQTIRTVIYPFGLKAKREQESQ